MKEWRLSGEMCGCCSQKVDCLVARRCLQPWVRTWVWRLLRNKKFTLLQDSQAHFALEYLAPGPLPWKIICGQFSSMHLLQMLVTGLIKRSPKGSMFTQGGRGKYSITEFGRKALDMLGPRTFPPEWGRTHKKRVVITEFKLNPFWVKHAKKYYW